MKKDTKWREIVPTLLSDDIIASSCHHIVSALAQMRPLARLASVGRQVTFRLLLKQLLPSSSLLLFFERNSIISINPSLIPITLSKHTNNHHNGNSSL
jgi:hypothetical protein